MSIKNTPDASDENGQPPLVEKNNTSKAKHLTKTSPLSRFIATACPTAVIRHQNTRSRSRTLSIEGRQAMLREFRQRRPTQRKAIIDSMLEGLTPEHVEKVYAQIELAKEAHEERFMKMRELWSRELDWGPRPYWSSDEATWSPKSISSWDYEAAVEEAEEDIESVWSCGQDSTFESLAWLTDNNAAADDDDGEERPKICEIDRLTPSTGFVLPEIKFNIPERREYDAESTEDSVTQMENEFATEMPQSRPEFRCVTGAEGSAVNTASGVLEWGSLSNGLGSTPSCPVSQHSSEGAVFVNGPMENTQIHGTDRQSTLHLRVSSARSRGACITTPFVIPMAIASDHMNPNATQDNLEKNIDEHATRNDLPQDTAMGFMKGESAFPSSAAGTLEELAKEVLPFVLDKDEIDFTRTLSQGVELWYQRGQNYMWQQPALRAKPPPGPSTLHKAWTPEDMALDDTKSSYDW